MRRLNPEEAVAWRKVARTVRPIAAVSSPKDEPQSIVSVPQPVVRAKAGTAIKAPPAQKSASKSPGTTLDGAWDRKLQRGTVLPDLTIDLHGHSLAAAHALLDRQLHFAIAQGLRTVLVITGLPRRNNARMPPTSRGVIHASVPDWLSASRHAGAIASIRTAHPKHGGAGALYLVIRRLRTHS